MPQLLQLVRTFLLMYQMVCSLDMCMCKNICATDGFMFSCLVDGRSVHTLILLYHLIPDTKTAINHHRVVCLVPVSALVCDCVHLSKCVNSHCNVYVYIGVCCLCATVSYHVHVSSTLYVLAVFSFSRKLLLQWMVEGRCPLHSHVVVVRGSLECIVDAFLVVEKKVLCKVPTKELPLALLSAFFTFNMHYPQGCTNLYLFLECFFMGKKTPYRKTRLSSFIGRLENFEL